MSTRDLIDAIESGDAAEIQHQFQQAVADRVADRIDDMRKDVARNMFSEGVNYEMIDGKARVYIKHNKPVVTPAEIRTIKGQLPKKPGKVWSFDTHGRDSEGHRYVDFALVREEYDLEEDIDAKDYHATSEKSFETGGYRPKVVHKAKGTAMPFRARVHLSSHSYKTPEHAKAHAQAYLDAYSRLGMHAAERAGHDFASKNKDKRVVVKHDLEEDIEAGDFVKAPNGHIYRVSDRDGSMLHTSKYHGNNKYGGNEMLHISKVVKVERTGKNTFQPLDEDTIEVEEYGLEEAVSSDSKNRYEYVNGKKPSGRGSWMFSTVHPKEHDVIKHKNQTFTSAPHTTFADAAKQATKHFKEKDHKGEIHVLP